MLYILLFTIIALQVIFYFKLKNEIEIEAIKQHNGILLDIKNIASEIYRDMKKASLSELFDDESEDKLYEQAKGIVIESGKASTSWIQRKLGIGYSRAARLMDLLEDNGIIGSENGSSPREVLIRKSNEKKH